MKIIICWLALGVVAFAQSTNAAPGLPSSTDDLEKRAADQANDLKELLNDKSLPDKKRLEALTMASEALQNYSDILTAAHARELLWKMRIEALGGRAVVESYVLGTKISVTTIAGKSYPDAVAKTWDNHSVTLITPDGGATIPFTDLPREIQDEFGYEPMLDTAPAPVIPPAPPDKKPMKAGLNILAFDAKKMDSEGGYDTISYQVVLFNNSDEDMDHVFVKFSYRDQDNFEVDHSTDETHAIKANQDYTVTGQTLMKDEQWTKVESYAVSTE